MSKPVAVFDSGLGGLTVVFNLQKSFPKEKIVYFGDTARLPYGTKSPETVRLFARENTSFLLTFLPKVVVVACHTASALALEALKSEFSLPIVGMLEPGVRAALGKTRTGRIGVIGTIATIKSNSYPAEIKKRDSKVQVFSCACPLFVPLVEEGLLSGRITELAAARYLAPLKRKGVDALILACTHYPLLKAAIAEFMGPKVTLVDPSEEVVAEVRPFLSAGKGRGLSPALKIYLSDITPNFRKVAASFLKRRLPNFEKVRLESGWKTDFR